MALPVKSMRAAILAASRKPLVVDEVELPDELEPGQVLVRVEKAGLCGSQLGEIDAIKGPDRFLPHLLGHEGVGRVLAVGPGVFTVKPEARVVLHWKEGTGIGCQAPVYGWRGDRLNAGWVTTFNDYAVVAENRITPVAEDVPADLAVFMGCPVTTGLGVITNEAQVKLGETVVILGAGGVGLVAVRGAVLASATPVVAVDRNAESLALARTLGASHTVLGQDEGVGEAVAEALGGAGADVVIETTGDRRMIELACQLTSASGRTVLVGVPDPSDPARIPTLPLHLGKRLIGSHGGAARPEVDIPRYSKLDRSGKLGLEPLATDSVRLEDINDAFDRLRKGAILGRCLVEIA